MVKSSLSAYQRKKWYSINKIKYTASNLTFSGICIVSILQISDYNHTIFYKHEFLLQTFLM